MSFPSLAHALIPHERPADRPFQAARVCIASPEFVGPSRNGGIGTAYTALAEALADAGHDVTCLYLLGTECASEDMAYWIRHFRERRLTLVPLPAVAQLDVPWHVHKAYETYQWLKQHDHFDTIHFPEWRGHGYYALLARHQGLAFANTTMCVGTHSMTAWLKTANRECLTDLSEVELDYMERQSVALADAVISPSAYLLDWVTDKGWELPASCYVQQNVLPKSARGTAARATRPLETITEIVFFGRLENRKGVSLFCDALDRLSPDVAGRLQQVTFLGKETIVSGLPARTFVNERAARWPWQVQLISDRNQPEAMEYLSQGGRLAVIPSLLENSPYTVLECLGAGISFLATRVGGIPELILEEDIDTVCFAPSAASLAHSLSSALSDGFRAARPALNASENERIWVAWHQHLAEVHHSTRREVAPAPQWPTVSLSLTTFNRPALLRQALESIYALDYPNLEVIVVDDGSTMPEALELLDELETPFARRGWRIVRQENRYLGAARNTGARLARGEYLLFMDDDNCAMPHELKTLVTAALHSDADVVTCGMNYFTGYDAPDPAGRPTGRWLPLGGASTVGAFRNCFGDANALVRKTCFEAVGGFTEDYGVTHEDWEFHANVVLKGFKLTVVPEFLFWYRGNADSMIRTLNWYPNYMRSIRPYLGAVPESLRSLVLLAQGMQMRRSAPSELYDFFASLPDDSLRATIGLLPGSRNDATIRTMRTRLQPLLEGWQQTTPRIILYGAGTHTRVLLAAVPELASYVVGLVDKSLSSGHFLDWPCTGPEAFEPDSCDVIVYSSKEHEVAMHADFGHHPVQHVLLYNQPDAGQVTGRRGRRSAAPTQRRERTRISKSPAVTGSSKETKSTVSRRPIPSS